MHPVRKEQPDGVARLSLDGRIPVTLRQHARLSIGVGGVAGGILLLTLNTVSVLLAGAAVSMVPFMANAALVFGGAMFLREHRRAARLESERRESPAAG